jgi:hypothetical protein
MPLRSVTSAGFAPAAGSRADSPKSWTTPWSNVLFKQQDVCFHQQNVHHWEAAADDRFHKTMFAELEIFGTGTPAADHGVVLDYAAAFGDVIRPCASLKWSASGRGP